MTKDKTPKGETHNNLVKEGRNTFITNTKNKYKSIDRL